VSEQGLTKKVSKRMYMHTLDGKPAFYIQGGQVCYANQGRSGHHRQLLVQSLAQLKAEQKASRAWRQSIGMADMASEYGYCIVGVP
jgi:hypothetical protein